MDGIAGVLGSSSMKYGMGLFEVEGFESVSDVAMGFT